MVQLLDLLAVFAGGWIAYQIRHFGPEGIADLRSVDLFLIVISCIHHLYLGQKKLSRKCLISVRTNGMVKICLR